MSFHIIMYVVDIYKNRISKAILINILWGNGDKIRSKLIISFESYMSTQMFTK